MTPIEFFPSREKKLIDFVANKVFIKVKIILKNVNNLEVIMRLFSLLMASCLIGCSENKKTSKADASATQMKPSEDIKQTESGVVYKEIYGEKIKGHLHKNGGGFVADTAKVDETAYIGKDAMVLHNARVSDNARVYENALVYDNAKVYENAQVYGKSTIWGYAKVYGNAKVFGRSVVTGNAVVSGNTVIYNKTVLGN